MYKILSFVYGKFDSCSLSNAILRILLKRLDVTIQALGYSHCLPFNPQCALMCPWMDFQCLDLRQRSHFVKGDGQSASSFPHSVACG
jgi:hypothetical protein